MRRATIGALVVLVLGACSTGNPDTTTYEDGADQRYLFELPKDWNVYPADELTQVGPLAFIPDLGAYPAVNFTAFDGAAGRDLTNLSLATSDAPFPQGAHIIRSISSQDRNLLSRQMLAASAYDLLNVEGLELIQDEDFTFGKDYDGIRRLYGITNEDGETSGVVYMLAVTNPDATEMYSMAAGCSLTCFNAQSDDIYKAVDSWLVNTRR